jgi:hypothetical protein
MEVDQGPILGCSAKEKNEWTNSLIQLLANEVKSIPLT